MTESVINFPSQAVSDLEKMSHEYGEKVAKAFTHVVAKPFEIGSLQQFKRLIKGYCIVDHYITDSNGYKYRTCKIYKGYTEKSFMRYIKINK